MQKLIINNFGPLKQVDLELKDLMVFIGTNASGKSTLAKLIYYFLNIPINLAKAHLESFGSKENDLNGAIHRSFWTFMSYNFPSSYTDDAYLKFEFDSEKYIIFKKTKNQHTLPFEIEFSYEIKQVFKRLSEQKTFFESKLSTSEDLKNSINFTEKKYQYFDEIKSFLNSEFSKLAEIKKYFISENRSSFSTKNEYNLTFQNSFSEIIKESQFFLNDILESGINKKEIVEIIGGQIFKFENNTFGVQLKSGEKIHFNELSSGQKEVFWLLISLFQIHKKNEPNYLFIEEPETHLFPNTQKILTEFLVSLFNNSFSKIILTTHSHYLIGVLNVLINAKRIGQINKHRVRKVIPEEYWLEKNSILVARLNNGTLENVFDLEAEMFDHDELSKTSSILNSEMDELFEIEFENAE